MQHTRVLAANEVGISLFLSSEVVAQRQLERLSNMPKSPNGLKRRASLNNRGGVKQGVLRGLHPNARERNNCVCVFVCVVISRYKKVPGENPPLLHSSY